MSILLKYVASSGNEYNLKSNGIRSKTANYHRWSWLPVGTQLQFGQRLSNFTRDAAIYETRLIFDGALSSRKSLVDNLHEDFERDLRNMTPGRIVWGDWYINGYITTSSTAPDMNNVWTDNDVSIWCPRPFWVKETTKHFYPVEEPQVQTYLDYTYDYQYDYTFDVSGGTVWVRDFPFESDFKLIIYGSAANPRILINDHPYQINDTINSGEYVTIDSRNNTVIKTLAMGVEVNDFDKREKSSSVFQQIPGGDLKIVWSGLFGFDLTLFEERNEPRWN